MQISTTDKIELRRPLLERWALIFAAIIVIAGFLAMGGFTVLAAVQMPEILPIMIPVLLVTAAMVFLILREAVARWVGEATIEGGRIHLKLPSMRGYVGYHAVDRDIVLNDIAGIEARNEAFASVGFTMVQTSYALVLADGSRIVLGGDRRAQPEFYGDIAEAIAEKRKIAIRGLGTVDGNAGFIVIMNQSVPGWETPGISEAEAAKREKAGAASWRFVSVLVLVCLLIYALAEAL